uniref:Ribosomal protein S8 n=1 Tax=Heterorhabditis bacteriophora TaxID=37862 RepID=A0A1I7XJX1_HETBA
MSFNLTGSSVEVCHLGACRSGVILWMGDAMSEDHDHIERSAVVELNEDVPSGWRSSHEAPNSDTCGVVHNGVLVPVSALRRDRRIDHHSSGCTQLISSSSGNLNGGKINLKDNKIDRMFLCPLIVDDWSGGVATTQHLLERSMREAGVKFVFPPKTLILQVTVHKMLTLGNGDLEQYTTNLLPSRQFGYLILTTSAGIMDHEEARRKHLGGKILGFFF